MPITATTIISSTRVNAEAVALLRACRLRMRANWVLVRMVLGIALSNSRLMLRARPVIHTLMEPAALRSFGALIRMRYLPKPLQSLAFSGQRTVKEPVHTLSAALRCRLISGQSPLLLDELSPFFNLAMVPVPSRQRGWPVPHVSLPWDLRKAFRLRSGSWPVTRLSGFGSW